MNNPRPVMSIRKTVQLMVILTLLAWATQTLFAQWGYGGLILPAPAAPSSSFGPAPAPAPAPPAAPLRFGRANGGATIELQPRARFDGHDTITLRDVCKWSDADAAVMEPLANTLIAKIGNAPRVRAVSVDDIKSRLHDAGANLSLLQFTGAATCAVLVGDEAGEPEIAFDQGRSSPAAPAPAPPLFPAPAATPAEQPVVGEMLEAQSAPQPVVAEPPPPVVHYDEQLVLTRPLSRGQRIIASDVAVKRVVVDQPTTRPAVALDEIVGNVASREMKKGDVLAPADISRPAVVTRGQFMTVALRVGTFDVQTVARAMDSAAAGEACRAKNEASGEVYRVVVTAPNEGRVMEHSSDDDVAVVPQQ